MTRPTIYELTLRDGLMIRPRISIKAKTELIDRLMKCGIYNFEVIRFPLDGKYSQFNEGIEILESLQRFRKDGALLAAFAMGEAGVAQATEFTSLFDELHIPCFVSDQYSAYAFGDWSWNRSLQLAEKTLQSCEGAGIEVTVGLGTSFGCPLRPGHEISWTVEKVRDLHKLGIQTIMLGDTAGTATPAMVRTTLAQVKCITDFRVLRVHFHNTLGRALLNSWTAAECGIDGIDTSLLGLGGEPHPYFISSDRVDNGNCATEELFPLLTTDGENKDDEASVFELYDIARWFASQLSGDVPGRAPFAQFIPLVIGDPGNEVSQGTHRH